MIVFVGALLYTQRVRSRNADGARSQGRAIAEAPERRARKISDVQERWQACGCGGEHVSHRGVTSQQGKGYGLGRGQAPPQSSVGPSGQTGMCC